MIDRILLCLSVRDLRAPVRSTDAGDVERAICCGTLGLFRPMGWSWPPALTYADSNSDRGVYVTMTPPHRTRGRTKRNSTRNPTQRHTSCVSPDRAHRRNVQLDSSRWRSRRCAPEGALVDRASSRPRVIAGPPGHSPEQSHALIAALRLFIDRSHIDCAQMCEAANALKKNMSAATTHL